MNTTKILLMVVVSNLVLAAKTHAQTETLTVQGNLPRLNYRDTAGNLLWSIPGNSVLWKLDGPFNAGVIVTTAAAPSNSININEGGVSIRGTGFPSAKLHVGTIGDATQPGEVRIDPGNPAAEATVVVQNAAINTELKLVSQAAGKNSSMRMITSKGNFSAIVSGTTGDFVVRDHRIGVTPITIVTGGLNNLALVVKNGNIGMGVANPTSKIQVSNGASLSTGGVWINASSRELKQDIQELSADEATRAVKTLKPVTYAYKSAPEDSQVGFIAEDVPALVATEDRKGLSSMDIVAVLTKVVQEQQTTLEQQQEQLRQQAEQLAAIRAELQDMKKK